MQNHRDLWVVLVVVSLAAQVAFGIMAAAGDGQPDTPAPPADAGEVEWSKWLAGQIGGKAEHQTFSQRRVDILTPDLAVEVEWCDRAKAAEACEQATYYATATGRRPAIVLLVGRRGYQVERVDFDWIVGQATRAGVDAVAVLDVRDPDVTSTLSHLGAANQ